jgi:glutamate synthase (NADPH/NADH) large chain
MSGGMAFVLDVAGHFPRRVNHDSVAVRRLGSAHWEQVVHELIAEHAEETGSKWAAALLAEWDKTRAQLWQVVPREMLSRLPHPLDDTPETVAAE